MSASIPESHTPNYTRYVLGLLTMVYVVNYVDRNLLAILLQSIKEDLQLSDSELGLLSGTAFGLFYAT
ncbi:MAG: MFS transporter, partial [Myxococcota bacterium]|nr:MFS transporter [Myxococcota bacterium]